MYGLPEGIDSFTSLFRNILSQGCDVARARADLEAFVDRQLARNQRYENDPRYAEYKSWISIMEQILADKPKPQYEVLNSIVAFYVDHGKDDKQMLLSDLSRLTNWGIAWRSGKLVPVIIDAGFSYSVAEIY